MKSPGEIRQLQQNTRAPIKNTNQSCKSEPEEFPIQYTICYALPYLFSALSEHWSPLTALLALDIVQQLFIALAQRVAAESLLSRLFSNSESNFRQNNFTQILAGFDAKIAHKVLNNSYISSKILISKDADICT